MQIKKLLSLVAILMISAGCTIHRDVSINYLPGENSPLSTLTPMTFLLQVDDDRPPSELGQLAHINKVIFVIKGGEAMNIGEALKTELEKSGHKIAPDETTQYDAIVKVSLKRMIFSWTDRATTLVKRILIIADVSVNKNQDSTGSSQFEVTEVQEKEYFLVGSGALEDMLNEAFHNFIRNIILDPNFTKPFES